MNKGNATCHFFEDQKPSPRFFDNLDSFEKKIYGYESWN